MLYIVTYFPQRPTRNIALLRQVQTFDKYAMLNATTFLVGASIAASTIRDRLKPHLRVNDQLFVAKLDKTAAWTGFDSSFSQWMRSAVEA